MATLQALNILFNYEPTDLELLDKLQESLERVVSFRKAGKYDGYELDSEGSNGAFFLKAPSSENLFKIILPVLKDTPFLKGAEVQMQVAAPDSEGSEVKTVKL